MAVGERALRTPEHAIDELAGSASSAGRPRRARARAAASASRRSDIVQIVSRKLRSQASRVAHAEQHLGLADRRRSARGRSSRRASRRSTCARRRPRPTTASPSSARSHSSHLVEVGDHVDPVVARTEPELLERELLRQRARARQPCAYQPHLVPPRWLERPDGRTMTSASQQIAVDRMRRTQ